jgi:hypothetical protein
VSVAYQPKGRLWEEFKVGQTFETAARTVDAGDVSLFAGLSGDFNPLHVNEEFARTTPFGGRVAHGILTLAISSGHQNQLGIFEGTIGPVRIAGVQHLVLRATKVPLVLLELLKQLKQGGDVGVEGLRDLLDLCVVKPNRALCYDLVVWH